MKQYRLLLFPLLALALLFSSCAEDFKVDAPYKNITVVYGLLNVDSNRNYIRIEKAFLDENKSAIDMALIPDSSYYAALDVHLKELSGSTVIFDETLNKIKLEDEGFPKDTTGSFFNAPNYAYKSTRKLNAGYTYRLVIKNTVTGEKDSSETALVNSAPTEFFITQFFSPTYTLHFANDNPQSNPTFLLSVRTPQNGALFEGIIRFHYVDKNLVTGVQIDKSFDWKFADGANPGGQAANRVDLITPQASFFPVFHENIGLPPANTNRFIDSADVFIWAGSPEFYTYNLINNSQGGITGDQVRPTYTNIKGAGVLGLFASRGVIVKYNVPIDNQTIDSLMHSATVSDLLIRGRSDH